MSTLLRHTRSAPRIPRALLGCFVIGDALVWVTQVMEDAFFAAIRSSGLHHDDIHVRGSIPEKMLRNAIAKVIMS